MLRDLEHTQLAHRPHDNGYDRAREEQAGDTPEGTLAYGRERIFRSAGTGLADWLQGAHISCDEGKDGHPDTALGQESEDGVLEESGGFAYFRGREEEVAIEGASEMGKDDSGRC